MDITQKTYLISFGILVVCLALAAIIYWYTGTIVIAIFFAPPIVHWILKQRRDSNSQE